MDAREIIGFILLVTASAYLVSRSSQATAYAPYPAPGALPDRSINLLPDWAPDYAQSSGMAPPASPEFADWYTQASPIEPAPYNPGGMTLDPWAELQAPTADEEITVDFPAMTEDFSPGATPSLDQRVNAFLAMIRELESNNDYAVIVGGAHFADFSDHPRIYVKKYNSSAAGAYQITRLTWNTVIQPALNLPDFSPASQDRAALYLLQYRGAYAALVANDLDRAMRLASLEWAALPYSSAGQNPKSLAQATSVYESFLYA